MINARAGAALAAEADTVRDGNQLQANFRKALSESELAVEWADEVGVQVAGQDQVLTAVRRERIKEPVPEQRVAAGRLAVIGHAEPHADHPRGERHAEEVGVRADQIQFRLRDRPQRVGLLGGDQDPILSAPSIPRDAHGGGAPLVEHLGERGLLAAWYVLSKYEHVRLEPHELPTDPGRGGPLVGAVVQVPGGHTEVHRINCRT